MIARSEPPPGGSGRRPPVPSPLRRIAARSRDEVHRASSPLELFFDLCFVVAIAQAGAQLVHAVAEGHSGEGVLNYAMVFFAIWWAWVEFSWFASAYDNDDVLYRVATLVQISGVLVLAAGVSQVFTDHDFLAVWLGYVIMRFALTAQWLRVAGATAGGERRMALRYAVGVLLCQVGWLGLLLLQERARPWVFLVMAIAELCVPLYAERQRVSAWHPHHIAERYGLFTIIVLGETIAAATAAVKSGIEEHHAWGELLPYAAGGLLIVFAAWWIYFVVPRPSAFQPGSLRMGLRPLSDLRFGRGDRCGHRDRRGTGGGQDLPLHARGQCGGDGAHRAVPDLGMGTARPVLQGGHRPTAGAARLCPDRSRLYLRGALGGLRGRCRGGAHGGDRHHAHRTAGGPSGTHGTAHHTRHRTSLTVPSTPLSRAGAVRARGTHPPWLNMTTIRAFGSGVRRTVVPAATARVGEGGTHSRMLRVCGSGMPQ